MTYFFRCLFFFCLFASAAHAHKPSDSYLTLQVQESTINGQWDIALRDLDFALGLDANGDAQISWGEVRAKHQAIAAYASSHLQLASNAQTCPLKVTQHLIDQHTDGAYAVLRFTAQCTQPVQTLQATYSLLFDVDPQHKGLLRLQLEAQTITGIFSPEKSRQEFSLQHTSRWQQFADYVREGVWHIWIGFDHILFLLALLLPALVVREAKQWRAVDGLKPAAWSVLKVVTAFTLAHSITLSLAALGIISLPSRLVESVIAASVVLAAMNNVFPLFKENRWMMAFVFGLIHGFGFASVLADLGLPQDALAISLLGFNIGVECGQLAIVAVFLPLAYALRRSWFYQKLILIGGSLTISALALVWLAERALDLKLMPF